MRHGPRRSRRAAVGERTYGGNGGGRDGGRAIDGLLDDARREVYGRDYVEGASGPRVRDMGGEMPRREGRIYGRRRRTG